MTGSAYILRTATDSDIPFLLTLRRATMSDHLQRAGHAVDDAALLQRVMYHFEGASLIELQGVVIGMMKVDRTSTPWHLIQIQVLPELQGRGHGEALLRMLVSEASASNVAVDLEVFKANRARLLYERAGFHCVGETVDSFVMRRDPVGLSSL